MIKVLKNLFKKKDKSLRWSFVPGKDIHAAHDAEGILYGSTTYITSENKYLAGVVHYYRYGPVHDFKYFDTLEEAKHWIEEEWGKSI